MSATAARKSSKSFLVLFFKNELLSCFRTRISMDGTASTSMPIAALHELLGVKNVITDPSELSFYSTDVYRRADIDAALVLRPGTIEELAGAVRLCTENNVSVIARGGGLSYTGGFLPVRVGSAIIDMQRLDRIVKLNKADMYVTVECGATWKSLYDRLKNHGLRTPYFGPMSGYASTIGGALSQGSIFLGSTQYGTTADSVLGLSVVVADGTVVTTGSAGASGDASPFFRNYGPDLTGPFLQDCGALGIKACATLRLLRAPAQTGFLSFTFSNHAAMLNAMSEISRQGLAAECFGADPYIWGMRLWDEDLARDVKRLVGAVRGSKSVAAGIKTGARMVYSGRAALKDVEYAVNVTVDGNGAAAVQQALADIRRIAAAGGREIEPTVPTAVRGAPFLPPNDILGPKGQRWAPSHGIVPHSRAIALVDALVKFLDARAEVLSRHEIEWGYVTFAISTNAILVEPMFYWPGARDPYHERMIAPVHLQKLPSLPANATAAEAMRTLRSELTRFWMQHQCAHLQIGKTYRYLESRQPVLRDMLFSLKQALDPKCLMNPGSLGLQ
jgi:FAD/FMN-containing dehydrogenase